MIYHIAISIEHISGCVLSANINHIIALQQEIEITFLLLIKPEMKMGESMISNGKCCIFHNCLLFTYHYMYYTLFCVLNQYMELCVCYSHCRGVK